MTFPQELVTPMIGTPVTILILVWLIFHRAAERKITGFMVGFGLLVWLGSALLLSRDSFLFRLSLYPIPNISLLFVPIIIGLNLLAKSRAFRTLVDNLYQPWIIGIQFSRVMGVVFLTLYARGLMPAEFAIPSGVGDIVIGLLAPIVALLVYFQFSFAKKVAIVWNIVGFADLAIAIVLGFFTSPTPYQQLALDNPNYLLFDFPLALVPTFAVPLSLLLHIFSLRVLLSKNTALRLSR